MALGINTGSSNGDFLPRIQYDAKAGRFFRIDREQDGGGTWVSKTEEISLPTRMVVDFEHIEVGWIRLAAGAVDFQMVPAGRPLPAQPSPDHRQGFRVKVYNKALGVRHWNHTAKCVLANVDSLHTEFVRQAKDHPGEVPVIAFLKTVPVTTGQGARKSTNYAPVMVIDSWIARPDALQAEAGAADAPPFEAAPAGHVPPPQTNGAQAPADADVDF